MTTKDGIWVDGVIEPSGRIFTPPFSHLVAMMPGRALWQIILIMFVGLHVVTWGGSWLADPVEFFDKSGSGIPDQDNFITSLLILLLCYFAAAEAWLARRARTLWTSLHPRLVLTDPERDAYARVIGKVPLSIWGPTAVLAVGLVVTVPYLEGRDIMVDGVAWDPWNLALQTPTALGHRILSIMIAFSGAGTISVALTESIRLSRLVKRVQGHDPLRGGSLAPFTRMGLDNALVTMGFVALYSPFLIDPSYYLPAAVIYLTLSVISGLGLMLPVLGVRRRIIQDKIKELDRIYAIIAEERQRLDGMTADDPKAAEKLRDMNVLLDLAGRIEAIREWPFNRSDFSRYGLYLLLPLLSWTGAALVEVFIDGLMG